MPVLSGPAFKCRMGSRDYWVMTWQFGILATSVNFAKDLPDYDSLPPAEKLQRDLNTNNIKKHIVPYLLTNENRFFGSMIIEIYKGSPTFEPYDLENFGWLTLEGDFMLYALDGQHRLAAIKEALAKEPHLSSEMQTIILVKHEETTKTRKLFTHINKNAKPTTTATNILLDDEDIFSQITRELEQGISLFKDRVNWKGNVLSPKSDKITTAKVLYSSVKVWLDERNLHAGKRVNPEKYEELYKEVKDIWEKIIESFEWFGKLKKGGEVQELRKQSIIFKPVGQQVLIEGVQNARNKNLSVQTIVNRLNRINWTYRGPLWKSIIYNPALETVINVKANVGHAGKLLGYCLGGKYDEDEKDALLNEIQKAYEGQPRQLHAQVR